MVFITLRLSAPKTIGTFSTVCRKLIQSNNFIPIVSSRRSINGKNTRDPEYKRIPPFPYKEKKYTMFRSWIDRTTYRFDANSKLIVVDGAIAAGKTEFAKELAEDLDMLYMPEGSMDGFYINPYGYDLRQLDPQLPDSCKSYDTKNFCLDPYHPNLAGMQCQLYLMKFSQHIDALAHILNTGQGVVMDKSCYSDFVYIEAMYKAGFISAKARSVYSDTRRDTIIELMRPHLQIYLDMPVDKVLEKIKQRGRPHEQNSKALTPKFLEALEDAYKRQYLKEINKHAELLIYDWSDGGDVEVVVEDIERIDFDKYDDHDERMKDWRFPTEQNWSDIRMDYTNDKYIIMQSFNIPRYDCPELVVSGEDMKVYNEVMETAPGMKFAEGYNEDMGDKNVLFKTGQKKFSFFY